MPDKTLGSCCSQYRINLLWQEKNKEIGFTWSYFCLLFLGPFSSEADVFILLFSFVPCISALVSVQCHLCFLVSVTVAKIKKKEQPNSIGFLVLLKVWLCLLFDYLFLIFFNLQEPKLDFHVVKCIEDLPIYTVFSKHKDNSM